MRKWSNRKMAALREELMAESESGKVTMVDWNNAWMKFTRSKDIYQTIHEIESTGNKAEYHPADVTDSSAIKAAVNGRIVTGIVHGAGLEESKLVADKEWSKFDLIVRVKVDGWKVFVASIDENLRFACAFTSVAEDFRNGGQTDYAAANSILDAEMARLTASGKGEQSQLDGLAGDVGMATRGSIEFCLKQQGFETLAVEDGVDIRKR